MNSGLRIMVSEWILMSENGSIAEITAIFPAVEWVGIRNVAERIQLSYGSSPFGVRFQERNEGGTVAILLLPADQFIDRENRHV